LLKSKTLLSTAKQRQKIFLDGKKDKRKSNDSGEKIAEGKYQQQ
jgi:hypothetical protein